MFKNLNAKVLAVSGFQSEIIELALSNGFRGIDLDVVDFTDRVQTRGLDYAQRFIDSAHVKIGCGRLPVTWGGDDEAFQRDLSALPTLAESLVTIGCTRLITSIDPATDERPYHENFEFHRQRFAEIAKALAPHGVRLGLAFNGAASAREGKQFEFIHDPDALLTLVSTVAEDNVGVVLDLWDVYASGGDVDVLGNVSVDQIVSVNVADAPVDIEAAQWTEEARLLPGETGIVDAVAALSRLSEMGYDGPVTPTPHRSHSHGMTREATVRLVGGKLDGIWKTGGLTPGGKLTATAENA